MLIANGNIFEKEGTFRQGNIHIDDSGRISRICYASETNEDTLPEACCDRAKESKTEESVIDARGLYVIPGLVDIHLHGCAGYDFCDGTQEAFETIAAFQIRNGVTSIVPATMTLPLEELRNIMQMAGAYMGTGAEVIQGITMEGPFISEKKKGAQDGRYIQKPSIALYRDLQQRAGGYIRQVTVAPEEAGALEFTKEVSRETVVSLAHTGASYEGAREAFAAGANHVTHLFNAMPAFGHRAPGVIGAAFDEKAVFVELICDGEHVHPGVVRATFQLFGADRICMISDSMRAAGMPDGEYSLGGQPVWVKGNRAESKDGSLAGSVSTLYDCMVKAVFDMGISLEEAVMSCTLTPAKSLGMEQECGVLEEGRSADIVLMDKSLRRRYILKAGKICSGYCN